MTGTVRWYSAQGFGFIDPSGSADGEAYYFHIRDVKGRSVIKPGDVVTFDTVHAAKGPRCVNVQAVRTKEALQCPQTT